jgi:hypothetical protein
MIKIPGTIGYKQTNRSDTQGTLWSTWNIDLQDNLGKIRVSPRLKTNTSSLNACPVAITRFGDRIFALAGTTIYRNTDGSGLPNDPFVADTSTSASTDYSSDVSDMVGAWNSLFATSPTKLRSLNSDTGGTWADEATITSSNHKLLYFRKFDRLYFTDLDSIKSMNQATAVLTSGDYTLPTDGTFGIVDIKATSQFIWIAGKTTTVKDNGGGIRQWDGISNTYKSYKLPNARAVVALVIDPTRDICMAMSDKGIMYEFNGGGFQECALGRLPYGTSFPYMGATPFGTQANDRFIHPNGLTFTRNNTVQAFINGLNSDNGATQNENLPSGRWEWTKDTGWIHIGAPSYDPISSSVTDYAQNRIARVGALADMTIANTTSGADGTILAGASIYTDATTIVSSIFFDNSIDTIQKYGYIVTTKIVSDQIEDTWQGFYTKHKKLLDSSDSITVKYRVSESAPTEITLTWTSSSTFTTTTDVSALVGYEVEVIQGKGSGKTAHIVSVTGSGTYTVTLDDTFTGATSGTAKARLQDWKKIGSQTNQTLKYFRGSINQSDTWVQLKVCMQFKGKDEVDGFILTNKTQEPAT